MIDQYPNLAAELLFTSRTQFITVLVLNLHLPTPRSAISCDFPSTPTPCLCAAQSYWLGVGAYLTSHGTSAKDFCDSIGLTIGSLLTSSHSFLFFPACRINFHILFNLILPSTSSRQLFTTISGYPKSKTMIFSTLVTPPQALLSNFQFSFPESLLLYPPC